MDTADLTLVAQMRQYAATGAARETREATRTSLREFASALGVAPSTLSRWESGRSVPQPTRALRWAKALHTLSTYATPDGEAA